MEGSRKRKRRRRVYEPNAQERRSNEEHSKIASLLKRALEEFQEWREEEKWDVGRLFCWLRDSERVRVLESTRMCHGEEEETVDVNWIFLEKMKSSVKPKFQKLYSDDSVSEKYDLFAKIHRNESEEEVLCQVHEYFLNMPPKSAFLCSDISNLEPLLKNCEMEGGFDLVLVDAPWENKSVHRGSQYQTLPNRKLNSLPFHRLLKQDDQRCFVCFWMTNRMKIRDYFMHTQLSIWNLKLISTWYWLKTDAHGSPVSQLDCHHRRPYERIYITTHISSQLEATKHVPQDLVIISKREQHSRKPAIHAFLKELLMGKDASVRCLEMFARELVPGWTSWGNEVLKFQVTAEPPLRRERAPGQYGSLDSLGIASNHQS